MEILCWEMSKDIGSIGSSWLEGYRNSKNKALGTHKATLYNACQNAQNVKAEYMVYGFQC